MFKNPSLTTRIGIGKLVGLFFGLIGFICLPWIWPAAPMMLRLGIVFWYTTLGAIIGVFGVYTWHPVLKLPMPWWFRAPLLGGWMNFVLSLFAWDTMDKMLISMFGPQGMFTSPLWFAVEGAIVGLIIGYIATRFGGEGIKTVEEAG